MRSDETPVRGRSKRRRWAVIGVTVAAVLAAGAGAQYSFADDVPTYSIGITHTVQYQIDPNGPSFREYVNGNGDVNGTSDAPPVVRPGQTISRSAAVTPYQSGSGTGVGGTVPIGGVTIGDLNNLITQITGPAVPIEQVPGTWQLQYTAADGSQKVLFADLRRDHTVLATTSPDGTRFAGSWDYSNLGTLDLRFANGASDVLWKVYLNSTGNGQGQRSAGIYGSVPAGSADTALFNQSQSAFTAIKDGAQDNAVAEVVNRVLEQRKAEAKSCLDGAADYLGALGAQGVALVKQLVTADLALLPADQAVGPAVEDAKAFIANPFGIKAAADNPAGWLCGQLVGLAVDRGIDKLGRFVPKAATGFDDLVPEVAEATPGLRLEDEVVTSPKRLDEFNLFCLANSFTPDTRVLLADGSSRPIADVTAGTRVLAEDPGTGRIAAEPVISTVSGTGLKDLRDVQIGGSTVTATAGHPFWLPRAHRWTVAGDLREGDVVATPTSTATIDAVRPHVDEATVDNLAVAELHTYFVLAGDVPVLVHNAGCTIADRISKLSQNSFLKDPDARIGDIAKEATAGKIGALGELAAAERLTAEGKTVTLIKPVENVKITNPEGQLVTKANPDFLIEINGQKQLVDIKSRDTLPTKGWVNDKIKEVNAQIRDNGDNALAANGAAELQLFGPGAADFASAKAVISDKVKGSFTPSVNRYVGRVSVYFDNVLKLEWRRQADGSIVQTVGQ